LSVDETELLLFLLDGSGSMKEINTPDGRRKVDHENAIVTSALQRLKDSSKANSFKVSLIYFSTRVIPDRDGERVYFPIHEAVQRYKDPVTVVGGEKTAIADAIDKAGSILDGYNSDEGMPREKRATILLFTDGLEVIRTRDAVVNSARAAMSHPVCPALATISFGKDADEYLLRDIASTANERQIRHLRNANVYQHLPDKQKLFLIGHDNDQVTEQKAIAIRNFVETLSMTALG